MVEGWKREEKALGRILRFPSGHYFSECHIMTPFYAFNDFFEFEIIVAPSTSLQDMT
jgi:hypothetical protein